MVARSAAILTPWQREAGKGHAALQQAKKQGLLQAAYVRATQYCRIHILNTLDAPPAGFKSNRRKARIMAKPCDWRYAALMVAVCGTLLSGCDAIVDSYQRDVAEEAYKKGLSAMQREDLDRAIEHFTDAIEARDGNSYVYRARATAYMAQENYEAAIADLGQAIRHKPGDAQLYFQRGIVYSRMKSHDEAITNFSNAIALNPNFAEAYLHRGAEYISQGDALKGVPDMQKAGDLAAQQLDVKAK